MERGVLSHPRTGRILKQLRPKAVIEIDHYKDVFCRAKQNHGLQNQIPMLILAEKQDHRIYPGAPVCQDFDEKHFFYTSCVMNCMYDCAYCYLKGMYPSGNLVIFVNLEETFREVRSRLAGNADDGEGLYLCISYDTDLLALENLTGFVREWAVLAKELPQLRVECRTKCARTDLWSTLPLAKNLIVAFTLSPQAVIECCEHRTPSLEDRIRSARAAMDAGFSVRLCFDPMIYVPEWKACYAEMIEKVKHRIAMERLRDVSVGSFRISKDYLKRLRKGQPDSAVVQFPFALDAGVYHYPDGLMNEMEEYLVGQLRECMPAERIFRWKS